MVGRQGCETTAWRVAWLARAARRDAAPSPAGRVWEDIVFRTIRASRPYLDVQGPGHRRLFGRYGNSGLPAEFDTVVSHDRRALTIVELKAMADYALRRDAVLVLSGKIRDHEMAPGFGWINVNPFIASAGLVGPEFCRWCFAEAIDVTDPRRFPLAVLARLPSFVRSELGGSRLWETHAALCDTLALTAGRVEAGPVCVLPYCRCNGSGRVPRGWPPCRRTSPIASGARSCAMGASEAAARRLCWMASHEISPGSA